MNSEFKNPQIYYRCQFDGEKLDSWDEVKAHGEETGHSSFRTIKREKDETG